MSSIDIPQIGHRFEHENASRRSGARRGLRHKVAHAAATCAMGAWFLLAITPVVVVICAIR